MSEGYVQGFVIAPNKSPEECMDLCADLGLIERMKHGDDEYVRYTQKGHNVLAGLMTLADNVDLDNPLKVS